LTEENIARATAKEVLGANAKKPDRPYSAEDLFRDLAKAQRTFAREIGDAKRWIESLRLSDLGGPLERALETRTAPSNAPSAV
jgi:hypothetical protein